MYLAELQMARGELLSLHEAEEEGIRHLWGFYVQRGSAIRQFRFRIRGEGRNEVMVLLVEEVSERSYHKLCIEHAGKGIMIRQYCKTVTNATLSLDIAVEAEEELVDIRKMLLRLADRTWISFERSSLPPYMDLMDISEVQPVRNGR